ncbi:MAG: amidase [Thermaerobacter sp.]|nr:amidase [Thermaerobacter sp.]
MVVKDTLQAFFNTEITLPGLERGPLAGLRFAAKEAFAVRGQITGAGNPDWLGTHAPAVRTATVIDRLCQAGATMTGKTHTDELMYGLNGENVHYGTPINPRAPGRIPGGSSSGSAAAVAGGLVDFAIGTDTGGSVRIPASYCGIYGFRPSHGRTDLDGVIPLAQSFDTVGWFARSPELLRTVGQVVLRGRPTASRFTRAVIASDAVDLLEEYLRRPVEHAIRRLAARFAVVQEHPVASGGLDAWMESFRILQGYEIWQNFGEWITAVQPRFGPGVRERFQWTGTISPEDRLRAFRLQQGWTAEFRERLASDTVVIMPTAPGVAPVRNTPTAVLNAFRDRVLRLTAISGLTGSPQVTIPLAEWEGIPVGVSLVGAPGTDEALLDTAAALAR